MANITPAIGLTTSNSILSTLLTALGINGWVLKNGVYNGCTFASFVQIPIVEDNPIVQNGENLFAAINEISGNPLGNDGNDIGQLFNTFLGTLQFSSKLMLQIATKSLPFANRCNTESMGTGGYEFKMTLLFLGTEYQKAIRNLENAILYGPSDPAQNLSLIHPVRGLIPGITRVTQFEETSTLANWNAATVQITFRSEQSTGGTIANSSIQNFTNALQAALGAVLGITSTASLFVDAVNSNGRVPTGQTSNLIYTQSTQIQTKSNALATTLFDNVNYVYKTSRTGATNSTLNAAPLNYTNLPPSLNQVVSYVKGQSAILLEAYQAQLNGVIKEIIESPFGAACNDLTNQIMGSMANLQAVTNLAIPSFPTLSYKVPYTMSIRNVVVQNGIGFNNIPKILINNPQILSPNYIPAGMVVQL